MQDKRPRSGLSHLTRGMYCQTEHSSYEIPDVVKNNYSALPSIPGRNLANDNDSMDSLSGLPTFRYIVLAVMRVLTDKEWKE